MMRYTTTVELSSLRSPGVKDVPHVTPDALGLGHPGQRECPPGPAARKGTFPYGQLENYFSEKMGNLFGTCHSK
jgi:hypothetical protein